MLLKKKWAIQGKRIYVYVLNLFYCSCSVTKLCPTFVTPWTAASQALLPLSPEVCSNSCPLSWWWCLTISSSAAPFSFGFSLFQHQVFSSELTLSIKWPKLWSFSFCISLSSEYSGLISFRIDWFDLAVHRTQGSSPAPQLLLFCCQVVSDSLQPCGLWLARPLCPWDFPGKNTGVGNHFLLQGIFPTQGSNHNHN